MTVFYGGKQVVPVDYEAEVSQRLLEACETGDLRSALECIGDEYVDVNFVGAVTLKCRKSEVVLRDESPSEVSFYYEEIKTDVTPLFVAVHAGNVALVKKLLSVGADVNQKLFRGFATTAAVREGHLKILEILIKAGAFQPACEEALVEASCHGQAMLVELLMSSDLIRPHVAVHALVTACSRGFADVVDILAQCDVDVNMTERSLLLSSKPSLHTNVDCTALVAAVVSRQVAVVHMLLKNGASTDVKVSLGAWSWDTVTGEEFRVGAGLAEPYSITCLAVEYYEITGSILRMLLKNFSPDAAHFGRTLLHHAILCGNAGAVEVLLSCGANVETSVKTKKSEFRPIHMAAHLGLSTILQCLINSGCDLNSKTNTGDTALMISAKYRHKECLRVLAMAGADFGLVNVAGESVSLIAEANGRSLGFQQTVIDVIRAGKLPITSNITLFSSLMLVAQAGDADALKMLITFEETDLDYQDDNGLSAVMLAASKGHVEAFRVLVYAGANVKLCNKAGETAITLSKLNQNHDLFERVMLEFAIKKGNCYAGGFYALHCAARHGDLVAVKLLSSRGSDVNLPDGDGYTPLMLAAKEGHGSVCKLLISWGAKCEFKNARGETALSLARKYPGMKDAENAILDEIARQLVLGGSNVQKYRKKGKGTPHSKEIIMVGDSGVLRWGKSKRRNVVCQEAEVGPSPSFQQNRRKSGDVDIAGIFRVLTSKNKELHFVCSGGCEMAELWVRGIKLVTRTAICN